MSTMQQTPVVILPRNNTSLRPLAEDSDKLLLPIGDKPIIFKTLQNLAAQGFQEAIIPLDDENELLLAYLQTLRIPGLRVILRTVESEMNELEILLNMRSTLKKRDFFVITSDLFLQGDLYDFWMIHHQMNVHVTAGIRQLPFDSRLSDAFFTAELVNRANINPYNYDWHHYACGLFLIKYDMLGEMVRDCDQSTVSEYVFHRMEEAGFVHFQDVEHMCTDLRNLDDYIHANFNWVRERFNGSRMAYIESGGGEAPLRVGEVFIDPDAYVSPKAILIGPTIIGRECKIEDRVVIQRSVLRRNVHVKKGAILRDCMVNRDVTIQAERQHVSQLILDDEMTFRTKDFKQATSILKNYPSHLGQRRPIKSVPRRGINLLA